MVPPLAQVAGHFPTTLSAEFGLDELLALRLQRHAHGGRMSAAIGRGVAHELRNVAQLVGMLRDAMQRGSDIPTALLEAVSLAEATLMRQIGTLERLPPQTRHTQPVMVADVVDRGIELIRRRRSGPKMSLASHVSRQLPAVFGVESDLDEAFWELLINAREAVEGRGFGSISVDAHQVGEMIQLIIDDDGPGISEPMRHCLFDPFTTSQSSDEHLGVGLPVARRLMEMNGGGLQMESTTHKGTRFVMMIPVYDAEKSGISAVIR